MNQVKIQIQTNYLITYFPYIISFIIVSLISFTIYHCFISLENRDEKDIPKIENRKLRWVMTHVPCPKWWPYVTLSLKTKIKKICIWTHMARTLAQSRPHLTRATCTFNFPFGGICGYEFSLWWKALPLKFCESLSTLHMAKNLDPKLFNLSQ